jgi:hypothetical protein
MAVRIVIDPATRVSKGSAACYWRAHTDGIHQAGAMVQVVRVPDLASVRSSVQNTS